MSGKLSVVCNIQDLVLDHVIVGNLNVIVFVQHSILHGAKLHIFAAFPLVLGAIAGMIHLVVRLSVNKIA